jgi:hypothetical protein
VIALIGNIPVNYLFGNIAQNFGISPLTSLAFAEIIIMLVLTLPIIHQYKL